MKVVAVDSLWQCETCFHQRGGECNTWCDSGESYRPSYQKLKVLDAEPVKHGKWKWVTIDRVDHCLCSRCGGLALYDDYGFHEKSRYCPKCGAKMGGGE